MFDVGTAVGYLLLDTSGWTKNLGAAKNALKTFQDETSTAADKFAAVRTGMISVGNTLTKNVTLPLAGVGAAAVKTAMDFDSAMSNVQAITGQVADESIADIIEKAKAMGLAFTEGTTATETAMNILSAKAQEMGAKTKFSASEAAEAFSYMAMAGWDAGQQISGIEGIMNLAAASGEDLALTSDIVTDALTAFGYTAEDTGMFVDVLAAASSNANTNVSMLGESFKYVAPVAGAMGYSVQDTATALGLMANSGIKASQAGTALRTLLTNMAKPTDQMSRAMDTLGLSLEDGEGNMYSLMEVMQQLRTGFNEGTMSSEEFADELAELEAAYADGTMPIEGYEEALDNLIVQMYGAEGAQRAQLAAMLAGKEGMSGLMAIVSASEEDFEKLATAIDNASGTVDTMAAVQLDNLKGKLTILGSSIEGAAIAFGELLMPIIGNVTDTIQGLVDWLNNLDETQKETLVKVLEIIAAIGPLLVIFGKVSTTIGKIIGLLSGAGGLSGVIAAITGPIGIAIAAVAALSIAWATNFGGIRDKTSEILDAIKEIISAAWDFISSLWESDFLGIQEITETILELIRVNFDTILTAISDIFKIFADAFNGDWEAVWEDVKKLFEDIWDGIKEWFRLALQILVDTLINLGLDLLEAAKKAFQSIKDGFKDKWDDIKRWFEGAVEDPIGTLKDAGTKIYNAGKDMFTSLWNGLKSVWQDIEDWINGTIEWITDRITFWKDKKSGMSSGTSQAETMATAISTASTDSAPMQYGGGTNTKQKRAMVEHNNPSSSTDTQRNVTVNIYSPDPVSPTKAAQEFKRTSQELALGFS